MIFACNNLVYMQVERQRAALLAVDTEAEEESAINRELAHVMCARVDAARKATERLLGVLQVHATSAMILFCSLC